MSESLLLSGDRSGAQEAPQQLSRVAIVISLAFLLIGSTTQNTVLQFWVKSFPEGVGGPYFILAWSSSLFVCFFGLMYLSKQIFRKDKVVSTRKFIWNYMIQGLANALNGVLVVYSSPINRTPPILFTVLINLGLVFGMFLTKYMIPSKRNINYLNISVGLSLLCLAASIGITIAGDIVAHQGEDTSFGWKSVFWMVMLTGGAFFGALYNVLQELYLLKTSGLIEPHEQNTNLLKTLFWTSLFQLMFMVCFFWVDLIPGFGYSSSVGGFFENLKGEVTCFFFGNGCGASNFLFGIAFTVGYIMSYFSGMYLNKESANFTVYAIALQAPFSILVFVITKLGTENTPLWSIIPSVFFIGTGIFLWKRWEKRNMELEIVYVKQFE